MEGSREETSIARSLLLLLLSTGQMTGLDCGMGPEMAMFAAAAGRSDYMARPQAVEQGLGWLTPLLLLLGLWADQVAH